MYFLMQIPNIFKFLILDHQGPRKVDFSDFDLPRSKKRQSIFWPMIKNVSQSCWNGGFLVQNFVLITLVVFILVYLVPPTQKWPKPKFSYTCSVKILENIPKIFCVGGKKIFLCSKWSIYFTDYFEHKKYFFPPTQNIFPMLIVLKGPVN